MTTIRYRGIEVEILDTFEMGGVRLAAVKAVNTRPFVGGDRYPVWTQYTTIHLDDVECGCVLPDQSCPVCRATARELYPLEETY